MPYYPRRKNNGNDLAKKIGYLLKNLRFYHKLEGIGILITLIGLFLPWISYDAEKSTNGFQNVGYLIGWIILIVIGVLALLLILRLFDRKPPKIPIKEYTLIFMSGAQIVLLSCIAFSIYSSFFHVTASYETRFGIGITLFGGVVVAFAGYLAWKEEQEENSKKTFLHLPDDEETVHDLERYLQKTKQEHKLLSVEDEAIQSGRESHTQSDNRKEPPNLSMFG